MTISTKTKGGCAIAKEDIPKVIGSITCCLAYCLYGACYSVLSASLPELAEAVNKEPSAFGIAYTTRGIGYFVGTLLAAYCLNMISFTLSKTLCASIALVVSGVSILVVGFTDLFPLILVLFFFQGIGFGGIEMMCNCAVPEFWELRAQPWMQGMSTSYGVGAVIGPLLVASLGYKSSFLFIAFATFVPLGAILLSKVYTLIVSQYTHSSNPNLNSNALQNIPSDGTVKSEYVMTNYGQQNASNSVTDVEEGKMEVSPQDINVENQVHPDIFQKRNPFNVSNEYSTIDTDLYDNSGINSSTHKNKYPFMKPLSPIQEDSSPTFKPLPDLVIEDDDTESVSTLNKQQITTPIPNMIRGLFCGYFFIYMGVSSGYGSWIPTFAIENEVTTSSSEAAYLISIFALASLVGRVCAIFIAMRFSATIMLRSQLVQLVTATVVLTIIGSKSYLDLCIASALMGFAISSIFGLAMTVLTDYGYTLNSTSTTFFMIGTTIGDAVLPLSIGYLMQYTEAKALVYVMLCLSVVLASIYITVHFLSVKVVEVVLVRERTASQTIELELQQSVHRIRARTRSRAASLLAGSESMSQLPTGFRKGSNAENVPLEQKSNTPRSRSASNLPGEQSATPRSRVRRTLLESSPVPRVLVVPPTSLGNHPLHRVYVVRRMHQGVVFVVGQHRHLLWSKYPWSMI